MRWESYFSFPDFCLVVVKVALQYLHLRVSSFHVDALQMVFARREGFLLFVGVAMTFRVCCFDEEGIIFLESFRPPTSMTKYGATAAKEVPRDGKGQHDHHGYH